MGTFNNNSRFGGSRGGGGGRSGGFRGAGGSRFGGNDGGHRRFRLADSGSRQMHEATCAECGNSCQVPFMPMSGKPVYCSDCFEKRGNGEDTGRAPRQSFDRPSFSEQRPFAAPAPRTQPKPSMDTKQLDMIHIKLDKILKALSAMSTPEEKPKKSAHQVVASEVAAMAEELNQELTPAPAKVKKARAKKVVAAEA